MYSIQGGLASGSFEGGCYCRQVFPKNPTRSMNQGDFLDTIHRGQRCWRGRRSAIKWCWNSWCIRHSVLGEGGSVQFLTRWNSPPHSALAPLQFPLARPLCAQFVPVPLAPVTIPIRIPFWSLLQLLPVGFRPRMPRWRLLRFPARWNSHLDAALASVAFHAHILPLQFPPACRVGVHCNSCHMPLEFVPA